MIRPLFLPAFGFFIALSAISVIGQEACLNIEETGDLQAVAEGDTNSIVPVVEIIGCGNKQKLSSEAEFSEYATVGCCDIKASVFVPNEDLKWSRLEVLLDGVLVTPKACVSAATVRLPGLAPGRHNIQARLLLDDGRWTDWSTDLLFSVDLPAPPTILSVTNSNSSSKLAATSDLITITEPTMKVVFAGSLPGYSIAAYLDDVEVTCCSSNGLLYLDTQNAYPPGIYTLTLRNVRKSGVGGACELASEASPSQQILYQPSKGVASCMISECMSTCVSKSSAAVQEHEIKLPLKNIQPKAEAPQVSKGIQDIKTYFEKGDASTYNVETLPTPTTNSRAVEKSLPSCVFVPGALPFRTLASVIPVEQTKSDESFDSSKEGVCKVAFTHGISFSEPASFPLRGYGQRGETFDREGLVIYEGMQLGFNNATGDYEVSFVAEVPAQPIDLRLQFFVYLSGGGVKTITLPPIRITASQIKENRDSTSWIIRHSGNSSALKCNNGQAIRRTGTVRFGYGTTLDESDRAGF